MKIKNAVIIFFFIGLCGLCGCTKPAYINLEPAARYVKITPKTVTNTKVIKTIEVSYAEKGMYATKDTFDELLKQEAYKLGADAVINVKYNIVSPGFGIGDYGTASGVAVKIDNKDKSSPDQDNIEIHRENPSKPGSSQIIADRTPPKIEIFEPEVKDRGIKRIVKKNLIVVKGKGTDESGIAEILVNGTSVSFDSAGNFEKKIDLDKGENYIVVKAFDKQNNVADIKIPVVYEKERKDQDNIGIQAENSSSSSVPQIIADRTPPKIEIFEPEVKDRGIKRIVRKNEIVVKGKGTDESGVAEILVNGTSVSFDTDGKFEKKIELDKGENYIIIKALDKQNNVADMKIPVVYEKERKPITENRTALVIGNKDYKTSPLKNTVNDARDISSSLETLGFEVIKLENQDLRQMETAIREFGRKINNKKGVGLFYYSGHGLQSDGINYLVPVDAVIEKKEDIKYEAVNAGQVLAEMEAAENPVNIIILDACRDNPFRSFSKDLKRGLAEMDAPSGAIISYATAPGSVAKDGDRRNGTYTEALLKYMKEPGLSINDIFMKTRKEVIEKTDRKQQPWESSSLIENFYFVSGE